MTATEHSITTVDILRHGRTTADDILRGRIDVSLSDEGYQQMQDRLQPYADPHPPWEAIITSPLQRCAQFARDLSEQHESPVSVDKNFLEMDFGDWDGRSFVELQAENPELFTNVWRQPHKYHPPNGETFQQFSSRITQAWRQLLEQYAGQHLLLICHGGVIRALLGEVLQIPPDAISRIEIPYASISRIKVYQQPGSEHWPQLVFHNPH